MKKRIIALILTLSLILSMGISVFAADSSATIIITDEDGVMTYTCSVCGETYTESIEYVAETEETTATSDSSAAATGDTNRVFLWTALAVIAAIGAAFIPIKMRFNNR